MIPWMDSRLLKWVLQIEKHSFRYFCYFEACAFMHVDSQKQKTIAVSKEF